MRRMHLNAMIFGVGSHIASWRLPDTDPLAVTRLSYWTDVAHKVEEGGFDALFLGDVLALQHEAPYKLTGALDTIVVLSALAAVTNRIGLIGTASTTFDHPYHIARRFASLDHISNGRVGWNIVTSSTLSEAKNFGRDALAPNEERYARAEDVLNAVLALWESWQPGARIADKKTGLYLDTNAVHNTNYTGTYTRSIGPLTVPRCPQGKPLLAQAGSSEIGRAFASRYADVVFTAQSHFKDARNFYADIKRRSMEAGREGDEILVFPGLLPIIGKTREEAQEKLRYLNELALPDNGIDRLSHVLGIDLAGFDMNQPLPMAILEKADDKTQPSRRKLILNEARRNHLTLKEMAERFICSRGHLMVVGTAEDVADTMQDWYQSGAADGFNILFASLPSDVDVFCRTVMPLLEQRNLRCKPDTGELLRERFGLSLQDANHNIKNRSTRHRHASSPLH